MGNKNLEIQGFIPHIEGARGVFKFGIWDNLFFGYP
jgi:hypothetical protein